MMHPAPPPAYPVVRLRPKAPAKSIRFGAPWVFSDNLVLDRRTRAIAPGAIVCLEDAERAPLGVGAFNTGSKIALRMMDPDPLARIDRNWLDQRIETALSLRQRLFEQPFYRLVHAEADGLPGVVIDRFGDTAVLQPNAAWAEAMAGDIAAGLAEVAGITSVYKNASGRARALEGLETPSELLRGRIDGPIPVPMNGAQYLADLEGGQKTGLFFDQRPNHAFAARLAAGGAVLDMFSHVGGFSLAALAGGAVSALAVDGSAQALDLARAGAELSGFGGRFETRKGDAFDVMQALEAEARVFDTVICDPPAFAPTKGSLEAGLRAYGRVARAGARLTAPGGYLVLCSCSHAADLPKFRSACMAGIGRAGRRAQIVHSGSAGPDHPVHPALAETSYLKALFLRLD